MPSLTPLYRLVASYNSPFLIHGEHYVTTQVAQGLLQHLPPALRPLVRVAIIWISSEIGRILTVGPASNLARGFESRRLEHLTIPLVEDVED